MCNITFHIISVPPRGFHSYIGRDNNNMAIEEGAEKEIYCNIPQVIPEPTAMAIKNGSQLIRFPRVQYREPYAWTKQKLVFTRYDNGKEDFNCVTEWMGQWITAAPRIPLNISCKQK